MTRRSIYVPDDLDERMKAASDEANWSEVACRAFEVELGEIVKRKKELNMEAVVQRLRASKIETETAKYTRGQREGATWATNVATYPELDNLDRFVQHWEAQHSYDFEWFCSNKEGSPYSSAELIASAILGLEEDDDEYGSGAAATFWHDDIDNASDGDWLRGFAEGALEVFHAVKDKL